MFRTLHRLNQRQFRLSYDGVWKLDLVYVKTLLLIRKKIFFGGGEKENGRGEQNQL